MAGCIPSDYVLIRLPFRNSRPTATLSVGTPAGLMLISGLGEPLLVSVAGLGVGNPMHRRPTVTGVVPVLGTAVSFPIRRSLSRNVYIDGPWPNRIEVRLSAALTLSSPFIPKLVLSSNRPVSLFGLRLVHPLVKVPYGLMLNLDNILSTCKFPSVGNMVPLVLRNNLL